MAKLSTMLPTLPQSTIPEILQRSPNAILNWRASLLPQISDLGPPDIIQLVKQEPKGPQLSTYLYYTGANTSSVASIAALLFEVASSISNTPQLWFGKTKSFKVLNGVYACYNAFSRLDLQIVVDIPGGVSWKVIDANGNSVDSTELTDSTEEEIESIWLETYVSAVIRSLVTCDDEGEFAPIVEIRRVNPFPDHESIATFIKGFEKLFYLGEQLGSNEEYQVASPIHNYLVDALLKCVEITNCSDLVLPVLTRLHEANPSVSYLIAKVMLIGNHEQQAVEFMHNQLKVTPFDADLLLVQSQYCLQKDQLEMALPLAIRAVNCAPSVFNCWSHLVKVYIGLNKFHDALLTLNACPMVTHKDKFTLKRITISSQPNGPPPTDIHLPLPTEVVLKGVSDLDPSKVVKEQTQCPPDLLKLPAANLKSTYKTAYGLLADLIRKLDWEQLLEYRAQVFVMEEELKSGKVEAGFKRKRLCERWLDNLFMLLYEDLKVFTLFKQNSQYQDAINGTSGLNNTHLGQWGYSESNEKSALEWEILGLVSDRLGHVRDSQRCFESALALRFSVRSARKLIEIYSRFRLRAKRALTVSSLGNGIGQHLPNNSLVSQTQQNGTKQIKDYTKFNDALLRLSMGLLAWEYKWYKFFSPKLYVCIEGLGRDMGVTKLKNAVDAAQKNGFGLAALFECTIKLLETWERLDREE